MSSCDACARPRSSCVVSACRPRARGAEEGGKTKYLRDVVSQLLGLGVDEDLVEELGVAAADPADVEEALHVVLGRDDGILRRGQRGARRRRVRGEEGGRVGVGRGAVWR